MNAEDVMTTQVITATPDMDAKGVADLLIRHRIGAVPVLDADGRLVGILSDGDLYRRAEIGTDRQSSGWLSLFFPDRAGEARDFVASHARKVEDLMTAPVITATPETPLREIAELLERHRIKRVPIVGGGKLLGIVSRANLVQAFATRKNKELGTAASDRVLRARVMKRLHEVPGARMWLVNVTIEDGVAHLWGPIEGESMRKAMRIAVETTPGIKQVNDHLYTMQQIAI